MNINFDGRRNIKCDNFLQCDELPWNHRNESIMFIRALSALQDFRLYGTCSAFFLLCSFNTREKTAAHVPDSVKSPRPTYMRLLLFATRLLTSEDECKWFWHQMIYFPRTINILSTRLYCHTYIHYNGFILHLPAMHVTYSVHAGILKSWRGRLPYPLVVFSSHYGSRLPSSYVRS